MYATRKQYTGPNVSFTPSLKRTATLMMSIFYMKELSEPWILIPASSKSVKKYGSYGRLNILQMNPMEAAIL